MRRLLLAFTLILVASVPVTAGTVTIDLGGTPLTLTSTAAHDAAIQRLVDRVNVHIAAQDVAWNAAHPLDPPRVTPPMTRSSWGRDVFVGAVQSLLRDMRAENTKAACEAYRALTSLKQAAIDADLGGKSPCQ